jgi:oxygen-independent coproporphyrinogen-3 oxidase
LALYVHLPWCVHKCPYCDFNSHAAEGPLPEGAYVDALLADLDAQLAAPAASRALVSVFIGGGTPSLFSGDALARLLEGIRGRCGLAADAEVTLEANPGAVDAGHFRAYRAAGVNRLSIGVQSLSALHLEALGRIHDPSQARAAVTAARAAGFENINLDMMFGLPRQTPAEACADLDALIELGPEHISYYQLTLEPNTAFAHAPPPVPDHDSLDAMAEQGAARLAAAGYGHYEVSAYARDGRRSRHNLNYWQFGDYLGIGAGAHGKLTDVTTGVVERRSNKRSPAQYVAGASKLGARRCLDDADLVLEFALNALRLVGGVETSLFTARTGLALERLAAALARLTAAGLLEPAPQRLAATPLGQRFLNDLVAGFAED